MDAVIFLYNFFVSFFLIGDGKQSFQAFYMG